MEQLFAMFCQDDFIVYGLHNLDPESLRRGTRGQGPKRGGISTAGHPKNNSKGERGQRRDHRRDRNPYRSSGL